MGMDDEAFDDAMRRTLRELPVPNEALMQRPRRDFLRLGIAAGLATLGVASWVGLQYQRTPKIVREAFAHIEEESYLRGMQMPVAGVQSMLGMSADHVFPGTLQLGKSCVIGGHAALHLNTFLDDLGYVHILAFRDRLPDSSGRGHWIDGYWQFVSRKNGTQILLLGKNSSALDVVSRNI
jgi:hypothetical protein